MSASTIPSALGVSPEVAAYTEEQLKAKQAAEARRRREGIRSLVIRLVSVATFLTVWQVFGGQIDPVLFTTPTKIAKAFWGMLQSGELWKYLAPSLLVLLYGLTIAVIAGITIGLLLARFRTADLAFDMYITFLYSTPSVALVPLIVLWAGYDTHGEDRGALPLRLLPHGHQHLPGGEERRPEPPGGGQGVPLLGSADVAAHHRPRLAALHRHRAPARRRPRADRHGHRRPLHGRVSGIGYLINKAATTYKVDNMFVPIVTLGILGVTLTAIMRVLEKRVAPWTAGADRH